MPCRVAPSPRGMWETRSAVRWDLRMPFPAVGMRMLSQRRDHARGGGQVSSGIDRASERDYLLDRLQNLRAILPVFAQELASARRQTARLRLENASLTEQVRELQRQRVPVSHTRLDRRTQAAARRGATPDSVLTVR
jgi:hypothetical protein